MERNNHPHPFNLPGLMAEYSWRHPNEICPMKMAAGNTGNCEGAACAWWNPYYGGCCIAANYYIQDYIGHAIVNIANQLRTKPEEA